EGGAALQDFLNVYRRRALSGEVVVIPAVVQGQASAQSLRAALAKAIKCGLSSSDLAFDVIVLTRGGGSMEDLWSFNDEGLAWDIYNCPIPIISAVGHQVDYTICDYVSDLRCETPTAAAQVLTQYQTEVSANLGRIKAQLLHTSLTLKARGPERLKELSPKNLVAILKERMSLASRRLRECRIDDKIERLSGFNELSLRLDDCSRKLVMNEQRRVEQLSFKIEKLGNMMSALNPKQVLNRGYTYVSNDSHKVVSNKASWNKLAKEQELNLHFSDGSVKIKRS
ncbi:MAG: exodeoxyribonuclease VII large subunit, partial [Halobacteriovorax sp.]|nr:exodeoxyribonuclease VII large subunit [Halobacteriovorax sp.]